MTLNSSNTSVATVPATVTFGAGATSANVQVTGIAVGSTVISASALPNVASVSANVNVQSQILLPSNVTLGLGQTAGFQVSLASPAGPSGAFVSLTSSNPSVVSVSPANFFINQGKTVPAATPQVTAVTNGSAIITATVFGDLPASQSVQVINATIAFSPNSATITGTGSASLALTLSTQAPAGGLTVNLSSNNTSVATVPATATFPANSTSTSVPIAGVNPGTAVITASALPNIAAVTANVTVVAPGSIVLPSFYTVGQFQTTPFTVSLGTPAPVGGLTVTLNVQDITKLTVTPTTVFFAAGSTTSTTTPQVYGADLGYSNITATAPGYTSASVQVHISDGIRINLPPSVTVGLGQSASYTVILDKAAPSGGTTISLSSTNPSIVSVSATAFVPQGATQPTTQPTVTGLNVGSAQINASAAGYTSASPQTVTVNATMSFTPATLSVTAATTQNATLTLSGPAPTGGLTINLASGNTSVATVPTSVTFAAGATTVAVPVTGVGTGSATITASTTAPNISSTTLSVTGTPVAGMILLPSNTSVVLGQSVAFPITLPSPAPLGGATVTLSSANTSLATVTSSVFVAAGATQPATQPQVTGVGFGNVNINASAPVYTSAVQQVKVGGTLSFSPNTVTIQGIATQNLNLTLSASAPTGGLTVNLSSSNTGVATVPSSVTISAGTTSVSVPVTGVNPPGNATITASTTAPNVPSTTAAATVTTGTILGAINVSNVSVGQGLENTLNITVTTAPTSDLQVTITSQNPANALVAGRVGDPGVTSVVATLPAGLTTLGGIYVQGLQSSGTASITATAANYSTGQAAVTLAKSGFVLAGPGGIGTSTIATSQGLTSTITVSPARLDSSLNFVEVENIAGGSSATVNVTSSNTTVGTISVSPVTINGGTNSATTTFNALQAGSTTLTASASGYSTPAQDASVTANVTAASIVAPNVTVGKNLETPVSVTLNGATSVNNTTVTVTSSSPGTMLLSTTGTDAGFATITLNIPFAGLTHVPTFYVYGLAGTGTASYTVAISGFPSATGTVTLQPSGVILSGPNGTGQVNFTTSTAAANSTITLYSALLDPSNNYVQPMALAGNQSVTVNVTSANTSFGVITSSPVTIAATTDSITTQFQPTGVGSSLISVSVPAGYNTPNQDTSVTAVVLQPGIAVSNNVTVGMNLEAGGLVSIGAAAATNTVVTLTSNNPALLLLAVNPTDTGSTTIQVTIPAGSTSATYYLIALASSGSATYTGSATGFGSRNGTVNMAPSGVAIAGPNGLGIPFFSASIAAGNTPLTLYIGQLDPTTHNFVIQQQVAGSLGISVTLGDSNSSIGTVPTPVTVAGGSSTAVVQFTPLLTGSTGISVVTPSGYTTSGNNTSLAATVTQ
jgi:hypothetical protein